MIIKHMKRGLLLLAVMLGGLALLIWLQVNVLARDTPLSAYVTLLIWGIGLVCLFLLVLIVNRVSAHVQHVEDSLQTRTYELALSEQRVREVMNQRAATEEALQRSVTHAEALLRTAARLNQTTDQKALLRAICEEAARVLKVPVAAIALFDPQQHQFNLAASVGLPAHFAQRTPPLPLAWFRDQVGDARQPFLVRDLRKVEQTTLSQLLLQFQFCTVAFVELHYRERLLGLLLVSTLEEPHDLDAGDLHLLSGFADQAAQAIANADLFKALRRLLQRTQSQSRQLGRIINAVPEGLLFLSHNRHVLLANTAGREMLAVLAPEHVKGVPLARLAGREIEALLAQCSASEPWCELRLDTGEERDASAPARVFEMTARALADDDDGGAWIVVLRDVSAERQRRQAAQSQDRLATVGQLAAGIAHDFNNIMAVITLYSQSLERNPDFPKRREYLATISAQAQHASALISQILDFSRSAGMEHARLDLLPFVKELVKLLQRTLPENISVRLEADSGGEYAIRADAARLRQALLNLALNGRDAMPEGGELQIALATLDLKSSEGAPVRGMAPGHYVCLSVADTGQGIAPEVQSHLFEPFYSTKSAEKGTGMGLAQVYGIVRQHAGEIEVDSSPGQGSRFTIYLPGLPDESAQGGTVEYGPDASAQVAPGSVTVLLVEDHEPTREAIGDTLELLGYDVLVAPTGREALALYDAQADAVDLVLSDMVMPEMGGVQLYRELMARDPQLKMIVMTGYPLEHEGRSLLEQGIVDWIRKPFSPDALGEKIREVLERDV